MTSKEEQKMKKFEIGKRYYTRSKCNHECIYTIDVISRTDKTIKALVDGKNIKTFRPYIYEDCEQVKPYGNYSMCPVISAGALNSTEKPNTYYTVVTCRFEGKITQVTPSANPYVSHKRTGNYVEEPDGWTHDETRKTFTYDQGCAEVLNAMHYSDTFEEEHGRFETKAEALEVLQKYKSWCKRNGKTFDIMEAYVAYRDEDDPEQDKYITFAPLENRDKTEFYI